jgi:OOP family OmpA-OmpF porin
MFTKIMTTIAICAFASLTWAQDDSSTSSQTSRMATPSANRMNVYDPVGWFPFIGLAGGYMTPNDTLLTEGSPGELRLLGSYFSDTRRSVLDFGAGFMADSFSQKSTVRDNFISGGVAELAWRYNTTNRWQFGPIVDAYIGGGNRYGSTDPTWTSFGGLQLLKEFPVRGMSMFRVGLKALTDLSIPRQEVNTVMLDLQWGFGESQAAPQVGESEPYRSTPVDTATTDLSDTSTTPAALGAAAGVGTTYGGMNSRRVIETDADAGTMTIRDESRMQFDTGSNTLSDDNRDFVQKVAAALAQRPDLYDRVEVVGFADQTGTDDINMRISKERAQSVATLLRQGGLDRTKISSSWKGASEPLYQSLLPEDLQQNRRVDIIFHAVKDQAALESLVNSVL